MAHVLTERGSRSATVTTELQLSVALQVRLKLCAPMGRSYEPACTQNIEDNEELKTRIDIHLLNSYTALLALRGMEARNASRQEVLQIGLDTSCYAPGNKARFFMSHDCHIPPCSQWMLKWAASYDVYITRNIECEQTEVRPPVAVQQ